MIDEPDQKTTRYYEWSMLNIIIQMIDEPKKLPIDMKDRRSINCQDSLGGFHSFPPRSRLYICKHSSILFIQKKKKKKQS